MTLIAHKFAVPFYWDGFFSAHSNCEKRPLGIPKSIPMP